jgi:hypothetical protein
VLFLSDSMLADLTALIRRDHDDLDRSLTAMADPTTSPGDALALLDAFRIGFTAHAVAQGTVLREVLGPLAPPRVLTTSMQAMFNDHRDQARALAVLARTRPSTNAWSTAVLELRVKLVEHAIRDELLQVSLYDHVSGDTRRALASGYATERLRKLPIVEGLTRQMVAPSVPLN